MCKGFSGGTSGLDLLSGYLSCVGKPSEHKSDHGQIDPGFFTGGQDFIVLGQAAPGGEPGKCAFNDPATLPPNAVFSFGGVAVMVIMLSF